MLPLSVFLTGIKLIGAAQAALPEVKSVIDAAISVMHPKTQQEAIAGYQDLIADNDDGYEKLDAKLAAAIAAEEPEQNNG